MAAIPKDPFMLVSYVNTQLRDFYPSVEELCKALDLNRAQLEEKLRAADYHYSQERNQFI